jgi:hypothetical protein
MFFDEPRVLMGLNKNHTRVIKATKQDEENRYKAFAKLEEKGAHIETVETADK